MKRKLLVVVITFIVSTVLIGCGMTHHYVKKSYNNVSTALLDGDSSEGFLRGN